MANFMYQLDWVWGAQIIWSNVILDVFVRLFLDEIPLPNMGGAQTIG